MKRILVFILTLVLGVCSAYIARYSIASLESNVPPIVEPSAKTNAVNLADPKPVYIPFFESFDGEQYFYGWLTAENFVGMSEVWAVSLSNAVSFEVDGKQQWDIMVRTLARDGTDSSDLFEAEKISIAGDRLGFRTNTVRGIRYELDGQFFKSGHIFEDEEPVFNGTMKKYSKGKLIASFTADFKYYEPFCLQ
jgi:hypothetical protein